jgi:imidazolonepropionase-like amidohydrolase
MARINNPMSICFVRTQLRLFCLATATLMVGGGPALVCGQDLAIKAGKIITVSGPVVENGVILIRDGRIVEVGQDVVIPVDLRVLDASQQVVMPGIVDPHSSAGLSQANERNAVVPFLSVVDGIDPVRSYYEESRRTGVTTAAVVPGNSTMIGGQAAIMKTAGGYVDDMLLVRAAGLKLSLQPPSGSRMSHLAKLRKELDAAKRQLAEKDDQKSGDPAGETPPPKETTDKPNTESATENQTDSAIVQDPASTDEGGDAAATEAATSSVANNALQDLLSGKTRAFIYCQNAADVGQAFRLLDDYGFTAILVLGPECFPAAAEIAKRGLTVILDPTLVFWKRDPVTRQDEKIILPKIYREAGVNYLFQSNDSDSRQSLGSSYFWFQAATAVSYGLPAEQALAALTLEPAKALGIDSYVGSIQPGRDADLVILTGDPLDVNTWVEKTIVNGQVAYERENDWKLKLLLEATPQ